ncbi:hypothetical protein BO99DRAFT_90259 [Aspergillus violaceofuscus CBS 115571]|uniref:Uncharacterized protein n=1 Tax=Aspergillus violaceofuscus (strain CBS 115571) TaxID=1450538 RepID=A0A2V5HQ78_ASPV1|nr:hypothetical protein BO99DRAFT_90259 [Aspergillus violaceofuscus CBS 115571]
MCCWLVSELVLVELLVFIVTTEYFLLSRRGCFSFLSFRLFSYSIQSLIHPSILPSTQSTNLFDNTRASAAFRLLPSHTDGPSPSNRFSYFSAFSFLFFPFLLFLFRFFYSTCMRLDETPSLGPGVICYAQVHLWPPLHTFPSPSMPPNVFHAFHAPMPPSSSTHPFLSYPSDRPPRLDLG